MDLYLLRHGDAGDPQFSAARDDERQLTKEGKEKTRAVVRAAVEMKYGSPDAVISSPLVRAEETAKIGRELFAPKAHYEISKTLLPGADLHATMAFVHSLSDRFNTVLLVGHNPHLTTFASALVSGSAWEVIEMKKSTLAIFTLTDLTPPRMRGVLRALLPPRIGNL